MRNLVQSVAKNVTTQLNLRQKNAIERVGTEPYGGRYGLLIRFSKELEESVDNYAVSGRWNPSVLYRKKILLS